jgi:hypothetical protein
MNKLVWYACYGSNINYDRFKYYIVGGEYPITEVKYDGCQDKTLPLDIKPVIIPCEMYFGKESPSWDCKGVSFIDINKKGFTLGRMYLITSDQFDEIRIQECEAWYNEIVDLGEVDGYRVKTFSNSERQKENEPSQKYLDVIRVGILDIYPMLNEYILT